jgi:Domain of unknown function (DUF222)
MDGFECMFDDLVASTAGTYGASAVDGWARVENAACARRLAAMAVMLEDAHAADGAAEREQWCLDNWGAVCAHIGAAQGVTSGTASGLLLVAVALRDRLPKVAALFAAGVIDYRTVRTIVTRSTLVIDPDARRHLDTALSEALASWGPMSQDRAEHAVDALIEQIDPQAVRRTQTQARSRSLDVHVEDGSGLATVFITLFAEHAAALEARADAFADTVCSKDPRTKEQRRADAVGALSQGNDRLPCLCGRQDCAAAQNPPSTGVVIYLVAHQDTITGPLAPANTDGPKAPDGPDDSAGRGGSAGPNDAPPRDDFGSAEPLDESKGVADALVADPTDDPTPADERDRIDRAAAQRSGDSGRTPDDRAAADRGADPADDCAGLNGLPPPMFTKPLHEVTWAQLTAPPPPGPSPSIRPAAMMGRRLLPGAITGRAAIGATLVSIVHPGLAPPEPRYRPSQKLAEFVRCRDLTCRFPGCREPATACDLDHTIAWPQGPTQASNLKCLCRTHHLLKTFWRGVGGWRDRQLADGTVVWTAPDGRTHTSTPGSRLLFPELCQPTAPTAPAVAAEIPAQPAHTAGLTMPRRKSTRRQDRTRGIHDERQLNRTLAEAAASAAKRAASEPPPPY